MSSIVKGIFKPYVVVLRHVFMRPHTLKYPYERLEFAERYRGRIVLNLDKCTGCGFCERICPNKAITLVQREFKGRKKRSPSLDYGRCAFCGLCVDVCPFKALKTTQIVELSTCSREELVHAPEKMAEEPPLEEVVKDLKKILEVKLTPHTVKYRIKRKVRK